MVRRCLTLEDQNVEYAPIEMIIDPLSLCTTDLYVGHLSNDTSTAEHQELNMLSDSVMSCLQSELND